MVEKLSADGAPGLIVYQAPWNWDHSWNRSQPLAAALARRCAVMYVDLGTSAPGAGARAWGRGVKRFLRGGLAKVAGRLWQEPWTEAMGERLTRVRWRSWRAGGGGVVRRDRPAGAYRKLRGVIERARPSQGEVWLVTSRPAAQGMLDVYGWDRVLVDMEDPWLELAWGKGFGTERIARCFERADAVFANGSRIARDYAGRFGRAIHSLPNGVDEWFVRQFEGEVGMPEAMRQGVAGGEKRIVFTGAVNDRFDLAEMVEVARRARGVRFYFVGPVKPARGSEGLWRELCALPHVRYVPPVAHGELAGWLRHADALLLPYAKAGGQAMFPAKLLEYVAAGKPILSTIDFSDEGIELPTLVHCGDAGALSAAIERVARGEMGVSEGVRKKCLEVALGQTWDRRAEEMIRVGGLERRG
ncbi:MAG: glycosyltransferase [Phycisphaeraceae bacterium]|nr:glycosyltransferase [Phycisphaeraceae bacterium]